MFEDIAKFVLDRVEEVVEVLPKLIVYEFGKALGFVGDSNDKNTTVNENFSEKLKDLLSDEDLKKVQETLKIDVESTRRKSKKL